MRDVQMDVLKKLMASMGDKSAGRFPKKGSAVLEITMHDHNPGGEMEIDDGQDGPQEEFDEKGLDPRLAAIMKKKKGGSSSGGGAPC